MTITIGWLWGALAIIAVVCLVSIAGSVAAIARVMQEFMVQIDNERRLMEEEVADRASRQ